MISVVLPTFNEMSTGVLPRLVEPLKRVADLELIAVDGGSDDGTVDFLQSSGFAVESAPQSTRAARLNAGIKWAQQEMILLHHPRSVLQAEGIADLKKVCDKRVWGGFKHGFDLSHPLLRFTSWYSNEVRFSRGIVYLDHCIFFHRSLLEPQEIPDVDIFEDTELSLLLREAGGSPVRSPFLSETSAIRFQKNGVYRQALTNQVLKLAYLLGVSSQKMNKVYERNTSLNNRYGRG